MSRFFFYAKGDFGDEMLVVIAFAERHPKLVARKIEIFRDGLPNSLAS